MGARVKQAPEGVEVIYSSGNVFADLGFDAEEAENLKIRSKLMGSIRQRISEDRLKQKEAAERFGVSQPRISELLSGKIDRFTIDALVNMHVHAGMKVSVEVEQEPT